jgi:hypothetical protein
LYNFSSDSQTNNPEMPAIKRPSHSRAIIHVYIYIDREREREIETERGREERRGRERETYRER